LGKYDRAKFTTATLRRETLAFLHLLRKQPDQSIDEVIREQLRLPKSDPNSKAAINLAEGLMLDTVALGAGFVAESISQRVKGHEDAKDVVTSVTAVTIGALGHRAGGKKGETLTSFSHGMMGLEGGRLSHRVFKSISVATESAPNLLQADSTPGPYRGAVSGSAFGLRSLTIPAGKDSRRKNPALEYSFF
jgi:hypothetical protein